MDKYLDSKSGASRWLHRQLTWQELLDYVRNLPYGRNTNRHDPSLVLQEEKGTCSSKHALLKLVADENNIKNVDLILCMYKMKGTNTEKVGVVLEKYNIDYIPEAHCYLNISNQKMDFTNPNSNISRIENDILEEKIITPNQVNEFKVQYHKNYLKQWLKKSSLQISFDELWRIREECIAALTSH